MREWTDFCKYFSFLFKLLQIPSDKELAECMKIISHLKNSKSWIFFGNFFIEILLILSGFGDCKTKVFVMSCSDIRQQNHEIWNFTPFIKVYSTFTVRSFHKVFATNSYFLVQISLQPDGLNIWFLKPRLFDLTEYSYFKKI